MSNTLRSARFPSGKRAGIRIVGWKYLNLEEIKYPDVEAAERVASRGNAMYTGSVKSILIAHKESRGGIAASDIAN